MSKPTVNASTQRKKKCCIILGHQWSIAQCICVCKAAKVCTSSPFRTVFLYHKHFCSSVEKRTRRVYCNSHCSPSSFMWLFSCTTSPLFPPLLQPDVSQFIRLRVCVCGGHGFRVLPFFAVRVPLCDTLRFLCGSLSLLMFPCDWWGCCCRGRAWCCACRSC